MTRLNPDQRDAGEPWAWAVHDDTSTIPCDEGSTCDFIVEYSDEEAKQAAHHHRSRLWDEGHFPTEEQCDEAVTVVPLYPRTHHPVVERDTMAAKLAEVERMRPVVEAVVAWRVVERAPEQWRELGRSLSAVGRAVDAYLASPPPTPPAVGPEPRYGDGTGGMVCKLCGLDWPDERETLEPHACPPGFVKVASALPDEQPPDGMIDRIISRHLPKLADAERQADRIHDLDRASEAMTPPVDIAAEWTDAIRLARSLLDPKDRNGHPVDVKRDAATYLARALIALADERATVEQRTAEAIAAWLERQHAPECCDACAAANAQDRHHAERIRSGRWRTP